MTNLLITYLIAGVFGCLGGILTTAVIMSILEYRDNNSTGDKT